MRDGANLAALRVSNEDSVGLIPCTMGGSSVLKIRSVIDPGELGMSPAHHGAVELCIIGCSLIRGRSLELGLLVGVSSPSDYDRQPARGRCECALRKKMVCACEGEDDGGGHVLLVGLLADTLLVEMEGVVERRGSGGRRAGGVSHRQEGSAVDS